MKSTVIGMGEIGKALYNVLSKKYETIGIDKNDNYSGTTEIMHVCIPWSDKFVDIVVDYCEIQNPIMIVVHSSVPVGTTFEVACATGIPCFHSPVRGRHPDMEQALMHYVKYVSYDFTYVTMAESIRDYFQNAGIAARVVKYTKKTELMKLLELCRYGVYLAFAKEQERICEKFNLDYKDVVTDYDITRNAGLQDMGLGDLKNPLLTPFKDYVGGHCTVEDMEILLEQIETPLLKQAYDIDRNTKVWGHCNIYKTAKIGKGCSIGSGTEIGHNVRIGNNVRIGAQCFLPEGVTVEDNVFIAPKVAISNDKYPPSRDKSKWGKVLIKNGARIGLGSIILPGVVIGEGALIGAGAIVTKDVPPGEKWFGVAAKPQGWANE